MRPAIEGRVKKEMEVELEEALEEMRVEMGRNLAE